jgi:hypothetical protein
MRTFNQPEARSDLQVERILREARRLIEAGWCQGAAAKDGGGKDVDPGSPAAVRFDPLGAIERAALNLFRGDGRYLVQNYYKGFYALAWGLHTGAAMTAWNNAPARRLADVLARFDRAIEQSAQPPVPHAPKMAA